MLASGFHDLCSTHSCLFPNMTPPEHLSLFAAPIWAVPVRDITRIAHIYPCCWSCGILGVLLMTSDTVRVQETNKDQGSAFGHCGIVAAASAVLADLEKGGILKVRFLLPIMTPVLITQLHAVCCL